MGRRQVLVLRCVPIPLLFLVALKPTPPFLFWMAKELALALPLGLKLQSMESSYLELLVSLVAVEPSAALAELLVAAVAVVASVASVAGAVAAPSALVEPSAALA